MIFDNMDAPILDDEGHVTGLLDDGNAPEESVEEEDIKEDNDDAQDTSESSDGEADYVNTTYIGTSNIELEFKYDSAYNIIACEYAYQSFWMSNKTITILIKTIIRFETRQLNFLLNNYLSCLVNLQVNVTKETKNNVFSSEN